MDVHFYEVNYWAVVIAALANFLIAAIWYSPPVLGKHWKREMNIPENEPVLEGIERVYIVIFSMAVISAIVLTLFIYALDVKTAIEGATIGLLVGLGFVCTTIAKNSLFESRSVKLYLITIFQHILSFLVMGAVLGGWQ